MRSLRRRFLRLRRERRLVALIAFRDEMRFLPGLFENLAGQVDGVVALDNGSSDGSAEFVRAQPLVLELWDAPDRYRRDGLWGQKLELAPIEPGRDYLPLGR